MKKMSTLALAPLFALGLAGLTVAAPAAAAKKEEAKAPGLKLSPEVVKVAKPAQDALQAKNYAVAEPLVAQVEAAAKSDDDKYLAAAFRFDLEQGKITAAQAANPNAPVNEAALAAPLDALIANPKTPAESRPQFALKRGMMAYNGHQYADARRLFEQAKQLGSKEPNLDLLLAEAKVNSGDVAGGLADIQSAADRQIAAGQKPAKDIYTYQLATAYKSHDKALTVKAMTSYTAAYPSPDTWRDVLVLYGVQHEPVDTLDRSQRIDLFRLMHDTHALVDAAVYEEYAQAAVDRGLPSEALAIVHEGQASGKLAGSRFATEITTQATAAARIEGNLSALETKAQSSADGKLAAQTADAYLSQGNNAKAATLYRLALGKGGVAADEVNTHLGIALARSGDKPGAIAAFATVQGAPRVRLAALWMAHLNQGG